MLILSRKLGEEIVIDGGIRITITSIRGERVQIGVTAPEHVQVLREEIRLKQLDHTEEPTPIICYRREDVACE